MVQYNSCRQSFGATDKAVVAIYHGCLANYCICSNIVASITSKICPVGAKNFILNSH